MLFLVGFLASFILVSFAEYWLHRFQHWGLIKGDDHAEHHRANKARGILCETWAYMLPGSLGALPLTALSYWFFGVGTAEGCFAGLYGSMFFSSWCHEVQHTNPHLVFWSLPLHYFHHNYTPKRNFGFSFSLWDRLFGTYEPLGWERKAVPWKEFRKVKWL